MSEDDHWKLVVGVRSFREEVAFDLAVTDRVAGIHLPRESSVILQRWYARTNVRCSLTPLLEWAQSSRIESHDICSDRRMWRLSLADLIERRPTNDPTLRRPCDPWPWSCGPGGLIQIMKYDGDPFPDLIRPEIPGIQAQCWICLEGIEILDGSLFDEVLAILLRHNNERLSAHEEIAEYILGISRTCANPAERAILEVVVDGVREMG